MLLLQQTGGIPIALVLHLLIVSCRIKKMKSLITDSKQEMANKIETASALQMIKSVELAYNKYVDQ